MAGAYGSLQGACNSPGAAGYSSMKFLLATSAFLLSLHADQMAEVAVPRALFADILRLIAGLRLPPDPAPA